jgi:hypothetical protein
MISNVVGRTNCNNKDLKVNESVNVEGKTLDLFENAYGRHS